MWRVVENALSARSHVAKPRPPPVENECGQMCTEHRVESATPPGSPVQFSTENRRDFTRNRDEITRRDARCHVTSCDDPGGARSVEKATPIHTHVWTDC